MTRKDFQIIATIISHLGLDPEDSVYVANAFAIELKNVNPNFKKDVFMEACGV